jgi:hypothetical protein
MFRAPSCPSSGATTTAVAASGLPSERGDSSAVGRGRAGRYVRIRTVVCCYHYSIELIAFFAEYTLLNNCNFNLVYRQSLLVLFNYVYYNVMIIRYCSYSCFVLLKMGDSKTRNM